MWLLSFQGAKKNLISPCFTVCTETRGITNTGMYKKRKQLMCFGGGGR